MAKQTPGRIGQSGRAITAFAQQHRKPRARTAGAGNSSVVVEAGLEDDQVVAVDEADEPVFLGDST
jgi:hypothetical protein